MSTNMRDTHNKSVGIFHEVLGVDSELIHQVMYDVKETYLVEIQNRNYNRIMVTIDELPAHLQ